MIAPITMNHWLCHRFSNSTYAQTRDQLIEAGRTGSA